MSRVSKYNEFLLEKEFNQIVDEFFRVLEDVEPKWIGPRTIEWDYTKKEEPQEQSTENEKDELTDLLINFGEKAYNKLRTFLQKLPKEKIKEYYIKLINKFKSLPQVLRRRIIGGITGVFLTFVSLTYLLGTTSDSDLSRGGFGLSDKQKQEIVSTQSRKSSFSEAQRLVKISEAGYSDDRGDNGNWIEIPGYGRRFVGTKYGISAPILAEYLGRAPKKEDMMNLKYSTAVDIFKHRFWDAQNLGELKNQNVANIIYDGCVNQGVDGMRTVLRKSFEENGLEIQDTDNIFSSEILNKANELDQVELFNSIKKFREERYRDSETFKRHGKGWLNRLDDLSYSGDYQLDNKI